MKLGDRLKSVIILLIGTFAVHAGVVLRHPDGVERQVPQSLASVREDLDKKVDQLPELVKLFVCKVKPSGGKDLQILDQHSKGEAGEWLLGKGMLGKFLPKKYTKGVPASLKFKDCANSDVVFHERSPFADTLVVVAPGFGNTIEQFAPVLWMFEDANVAFFNFRGHHKKTGIRHWFSKKANLRFNPDKTKLGKCEEAEVLAVTSFFKNYNRVVPYKKVVGLGFCFGAAMMVKAQEKDPGLFTHLILDSLWPRFALLRDQFLKHPGLLTAPQSVPDLKKQNSAFARFFYKIFAEILFFKQRLGFDYDIAAALSKIQVPILLSHGTSDALISNADFDVLWNSIKHEQRFAMITENKHLLNYLKDRSYFKILANKFVESGVQGLVEISS